MSEDLGTAEPAGAALIEPKRRQQAILRCTKGALSKAQQALAALSRNTH